MVMKLINNNNNNNNNNINNNNNNNNYNKLFSFIVEGPCQVTTFIELSPMSYLLYLLFSSLSCSKGRVL